MAKKAKAKEVRSDFAVDKEALDTEWEGQPDRFHGYAVQLADAKLAHEQAKNLLEVTRAELDRDIRSEPDQFEVEKITEEVVKNTILLQKKYRKQQDVVNAAKHTVDVLQAAVTSLDHRKKALENLAYLHGQQYYSTPTKVGKKYRRDEEDEDDDE